MSASAIAFSPLRQAWPRNRNGQAGELAVQSVNVLFQVRFPPSRAPRARLTRRIRNFATYRHE